MVTPKLYTSAMNASPAADACPTSTWSRVERLSGECHLLTGAEQWRTFECRVSLGGGQRERESTGFQGSGFQGSGFRVQGSGYRAQGSGFRVQGAGFGFRVQGSGFRVQGSGFRVQGTSGADHAGVPSTATVEVTVAPSSSWGGEREIFIDNPLVRVHLIIEMIVVERPCAM